MENSGKKRMSILSIAILLMLTLVIVFICLKLFVFDKSNSNNAINKGDQITSIEGEQYVEYEGTAKINSSEYLKGEKYLDDYIFSGFYIYAIDGVTRIEFDVCNDSDNRQKLDSFKFSIYEEDGKVGTITCYGEEFAAKQTKRLSVTVDYDVANMLDIVIEPVYSNVM